LCASFGTSTCASTAALSNGSCAPILELAAIALAGFAMMRYRRDRLLPPEPVSRPDAEDDRAVLVGA